MKSSTRCFAGLLSALLLPGPIHAAVTPLVSHGDEWHYCKGTNAPQADWKAVGATLNSRWLTGRGGFGIGTDAQETINCQTILRDMIGNAATNYTTLYMRRAFTIGEAVDTNAHLFLQMDWDDGYMAWLDGVHLTNFAVSGAPNEPLHTAVATSNHECSTGQSGSSPQPARTTDLGVVGGRLERGDHVLAILGLNSSKTSSDFVQVADLYLQGDIATNTTFYASNSPYVLEGSVTVASQATLTIEAGVTVRFRQGSSLTVRGRLLADGTESQPITFTRYPGDSTWERIRFIKAEESRLQHCIVEYADCVGDHQDYYPDDCGPPPVYGPRDYHEAVVVLASHVDFDGCSFTNLPSAAPEATGDALAIVSDDLEYPGVASANIRNCNFIRIGQGVHTRFAYVLVENCVFQDKHGDNDDVDLYGESSPPPIIRNNLFLPPIYEDRINPTRCSALIIGNIIYGSPDHGVVLRDAGRPIMINNVIYDCGAAGISVQNSCDALLINNTLFNCGRGIRLFDHTDRLREPYCLTPGSGRATLINCIIWDCPTAFDLADSTNGSSYVNVSYCDVQGGATRLVKGPNSTFVWGPGNIDSNPLFDSPGTNFHLLAGSPGIDSGTNLSGLVAADFDGVPRPLDGDGAAGPAFDMGAYELLMPTGDSNGDGIPDGWVWQYGLSPVDPNVATADPDQDSASTSEEWVADTDPTNGLSYFHIAAISNLPPAKVYFQSSSSRQYTLFYCTNLAERVWRTVPGQSDIPGTGGLDVVTDSAAAPERYYRVGVKVP